MGAMPLSSVHVQERRVTGSNSSFKSTGIFAHFPLIEESYIILFFNLLLKSASTPIRNTLIENEHLGDWSPEMDCCWQLLF